ncbi:MAG: sigma-70 family RNA polymerase sigma factor [Gemmatales bacterium]
MSDLVTFLGKEIVNPANERVTDSQLVEAVVAEHDEAAFEMLIRRHGSMVWGVCSRMVQQQQDAEDAFQATFMTLLQKAGTIKPRGMVGNWLHGVAIRAAQKVKSDRYRRLDKEKRAAEIMSEEINTASPDKELKQLLDQELQRLPDKYRAPIILCDLEGKTRGQVAQELGWPEGSVAGRLARARQLLARRLARSCIPAVQAGLVCIEAARGSVVPIQLLAGTRQLASAFLAGQTSLATLSPQVAFIMKGVHSDMLIATLKGKLAMALVVLCVGMGLGSLAIAMAGKELPFMATAHPTKGVQSRVVQIEKAELLKAELDKLRGTWDVATLEVDGGKLPEAAYFGANIIVEGDTFKMTSTGAVYQGTFKIDVGKSPKTIDLHFAEGPEKGKTNLGIYEVNGDQWRICLCMKDNGERPKEFKSSSGSQCAVETLKRRGKNDIKTDQTFLAGEWTMVSGERDGQTLPDDIVEGMKRVAADGETTVTLSGQRFMRAKYTIDPTQKPKTINYVLTDGPNLGKTQLGIYEIIDDNLVRFCFAAPGTERPKDFTTKAGSNRTLSVWRRVVKGL